MGSLPRVSGAEAVRTLQRLGFAVVRQRGSHIVMRRGSMGCVVPNHRELKLGTLTGVLKQAGSRQPSFSPHSAELSSRPMRLLQNKTWSMATCCVVNYNI